MLEEITDWILLWFSERTSVSVSELRENLEESYFEQGHIDSLKFIHLITEVEDKYSIRFENDEFQNREFTNILGLSKIIKNKIKEQKI